MAGGRFRLAEEDPTGPGEAQMMREKCCLHAADGPGLPANSPASPGGRLKHAAELPEPHGGKQKHAGGRYFLLCRRRFRASGLQPDVIPAFLPVPDTLFYAKTKKC